MDSIEFGEQTVFACGHVARLHSRIDYIHFASEPWNEVPAFQGANELLWSFSSDFSSVSLVKLIMLITFFFNFF